MRMLLLAAVLLWVALPASATPFTWFAEGEILEGPESVLGQGFELTVRFEYGPGPVRGPGVEAWSVAGSFDLEVGGVAWQQVGPVSITVGSSSLSQDPRPHSLQVYSTVEPPPEVAPAGIRRGWITAALVLEDPDAEHFPLGSPPMGLPAAEALARAELRVTSSSSFCWGDSRGGTCEPLLSMRGVVHELATLEGDPARVPEPALGALLAVAALLGLRPRA